MKNTLILHLANVSALHKSHRKFSKSFGTVVEKIKNSFYFKVLL